MGNVIFVTGLKGGVGKTTVSVCLASCLAALGKKVLVVDGSFGMRCTDLAMGIENGVVYDCRDLLNKLCTDDDAIVSCGEGLDLLTAPMNLEGMDPLEHAYRELFDRLKKRYDFIIIDSGAFSAPQYRCFASLSDQALVVSTQRSASVRASGRATQVLYEYGVANIRLIINEFKKKSELPDITDVITGSSLQLLGVVPFDAGLAEDQEKGALAFNGDKNRKAKIYEIAFMNIAKRILEQRVPLFAGQKLPGKLKMYL